MVDLVSVVDKPTRNIIASEHPIILKFYQSSLQLSSNHFAVCKNLRSSNLFPTSCKPNGKSFSPVSKGREIEGRPK